MPRIQPIQTADADADTRSTLEQVRKRLGMVPNLMATLAASPASLNAYLLMSSTLENGKLSARQREIIALAVAQYNACGYCLSAHTALARAAGLSDEAIAQARRGTAIDSRDAAIAAFARQLAVQRGQVDDADLQRVHAAGVDASLVLEIVANVALNVLTNYVNHVADTEIDFPHVDLDAA